MPETIPKSSPFDRWNHHPQMVDLFPTSLYGVLDFWLCTPGCRLLLLPPPPSHTTCSHTTCSHTTCSHTACSHTTYSHTTWLLATPWLFVWQAWHSATSTCILRGRRGTYSTGLALVARLGPVWRRCRRGCLCGRCGTWRHRRAFCVAGVAPTALSPNLSCTISFPSCLSHLIFTSAWWSLEEINMWGYPVL